MGFRFRQSFSVIPGLRLNLSKSGLSASIGGAPFTLNVGARGVMGTLSIPGTGISYRQNLSTTPRTLRSGSDSQEPGRITPALIPDAIPMLHAAPVQQIHSASTELLTSESLKDLKKLLQTAYDQHEEISSELGTARTEKVAATRRFDRWNEGFLLKRIFKRAFARRKEIAGTATANVAELEEQLRLTTIATHIEIENEQAELYHRMRDDFAALSECAAIWDVKTRQETNQVRERTTAVSRVGRERVKFSLDGSDIIQWEQKVPHLHNVKGGDLYLYPGFVLYREARHAFSVIEYHDVHGQIRMQSFQEEESVPSDSVVVGQTWAKANKDGTQDRRFADNYRIPIAQYGAVSLKSDAGLWEEFMFSNPAKLVTFLNSFNAFAASFAPIKSESTT